MRSPLALATVLPVALIASSAGAVDWSLTGSISERLEADTNFGLDTDDDGAAFASTTGLNLGLTASTQRAEWRLEQGASGRFSIGPGVEDETEANGLRPSVDGSVTYRGRRFSVGANLSFDRRSTEFTDFDEDEVFDNGVFVPRDALQTERETVETRVGLRGNWSYQLDSVNSLTAGTSVRIRRFDDDEAGLTPNTSYGGSIGWSRRVDARTSLGLNASILRFTADDDDDTKSISSSVSGSASYSLSPRASVSGSVGLSATRTTENEGAAGMATRDSDFDVGVIGSVGASLSGLRNSMSFNLSQSVAPSDEGELRNLTSVGLRASQDLTPLTSVSLNTRYAVATGGVDEGREADDADDGGVQHLFSLSPRFSYDFARDWRASVGYRFRFDQDDGETAVSNAVFLSVSHNFALIP